MYTSQTMVLMSVVFLENQYPKKRGQMTAETSEAFSDVPDGMGAMVYEHSLSENIRPTPWTRFQD